MAMLNYPFPIPGVTGWPWPWYPQQPPHGFFEKTAEMAELFRGITFGPDYGPGYGPHPAPGGPHGYFDSTLAILLSAIALKATAANLPDQALYNAAGQSLASLEDEYCGTPPRPVPTIAMAVSLASFANSLQAGPLQAAIQSEASQLAQKAFAATPATQPAPAATASAV